MTLLHVFELRIDPRVGGLLATLLALAAFAVPSTAAAGAGELSLDREAVTDLLHAGMPGPIPVELAPLGEIHVRLSASGAARFVNGGVEAPIRFEIPELGLAGSLRLRYVPDVDPVEGVVRLVAASAVPEAPVRLGIDLAPYLPPIELPREIAWRTEGATGPVEIVVHAHGVEVEPDRLVVQFGVAARKVRP